LDGSERTQASDCAAAGCPLRKQQVAALDTETGETHERQLVHEGSAASVARRGGTPQRLRQPGASDSFTVAVH